MNKPKDLLIDKTWKCCHEIIIIFNFSNLNTKCSPLIFQKNESKRRDWGGHNLKKGTVFLWFFTFLPTMQSPGSLYF